MVDKDSHCVQIALANNYASVSTAVVFSDKLNWDRRREQE